MRVPHPRIKICKVIRIVHGVYEVFAIIILKKLFLVTSDIKMLLD